MPQYRASVPSSSAICGRLKSAKKNAHMPASSAYRARRWAGSLGSQRGPLGPVGRLEPGPVPKLPPWRLGWRLLHWLPQAGGCCGRWSSSPLCPSASSGRGCHGWSGLPSGGGANGLSSCWSPFCPPGAEEDGDCCSRSSGVVRDMRARLIAAPRSWREAE
ncbi:hypothetical protein SSPO_057610 [Streptomyces antimycoticus]|uniref:Uncharacterized protein n=1 Tax=Streptomyces antimycoticus TaxID=68175 RepID=A0A499UMJ7_9ACTN|nr:hypothetical protein SSPO_057610 [Streptomyces antimycoticus]